MRKLTFPKVNRAQCSGWAPLSRAYHRNGLTQRIKVLHQVEDRAQRCEGRFGYTKHRHHGETFCRWTLPWLKLNFDGSKESETLEAGAGFIIRNDLGRALAARAIYLQTNDVNEG